MPSLDGLVLNQLLGTVNSPKVKPAYISSSILALIFTSIYYLYYKFKALVYINEQYFGNVFLTTKPKNTITNVQWSNNEIIQRTT